MKTFNIQQNSAKTRKKHVKTGVWEVKKHRGEYIERRKKGKCEQIAHGGGDRFCRLDRFCRGAGAYAQKYKRARDVQHIVKYSAYNAAAQAD